MAGCVLWFTGISGSGKTTITVALEEELKRRGLKVERLDGDVVRKGLTADLGFSKADRDKNIQRVTFVAKLLSRNDVVVLTAFISPYRETRDWVRGQVTNFVEVFVDCSLEECVRRDTKNMYAKAMRGEMEEFTVISSPYEVPLRPDMVLHTAPISGSSVSDCVLRVIGNVERDGFIEQTG